MPNTPRQRLTSTLATNFAVRALVGRSHADPLRSSTLTTRAFTYPLRKIHSFGHLTSTDVGEHNMNHSTSCHAPGRSIQEGPIVLRLTIGAIQTVLHHIRHVTLRSSRHTVSFCLPLRCRTDPTMSRPLHMSAHKRPLFQLLCRVWEPSRAAFANTTLQLTLRHPASPRRTPSPRQLRPLATDRCPDFRYSSLARPRRSATFSGTCMCLTLVACEMGLCPGQPLTIETTLLNTVPDVERKCPA